jgi:hypothetical protein
VITLSERRNEGPAKQKACAENFSTAQKELGDTFAEANQHWLARAKAEGDSVSDH